MHRSRSSSELRSRGIVSGGWEAPAGLATSKSDGVGIACAGESPRGTGCELPAMGSDGRAPSSCAAAGEGAPAISGACESAIRRTGFKEVLAFGVCPEACRGAPCALCSRAPGERWCARAAGEARPSASMSVSLSRLMGTLAASTGDFERFGCGAATSVGLATPSGADEEGRSGRWPPASSPCASCGRDATATNALTSHGALGFRADCVFLSPS
mmetsp:Transcript_11986/g.35476  ORF Transcript_11986/g.35476 Transcript_11986/m.35476 type:complete len:214 (-) Transcript_11986:381-1022(-)